MEGVGFRTWILAGAAFLAGGPALADVKAGVDAWTRGDYGAAISAWIDPAAKGDPDAQFNLGQAYKLGRGVPRDLTKAEELFGKAAQQGHPQASDNYGLLLFQRGERAQAIPYLIAGAERGDPRAQYLLGIAHFNGDVVAKDWVRAYALASLARQAGLSQAASALAQMDQHIPIKQRQQAVALAADLASRAAATRASQLASANLADDASAASPPPSKAAVPDVASGQRSAVAATSRIAGTDGPRNAGADFARPQNPDPAKAPSAQAATPPNAQSGGWRIQLGAFGVSANADALWARVKDRPELRDKDRLLVRSAGLSKLQAGGFASRADAQAACTRLSAAGINCLIVRN